MLPEQVVENRPVLLVDSLHFVDVLGDLFHTLQRLCLSRGRNRGDGTARQ